MARKPAHLELTGGKGPRQRLWDAIRAKRGEEWSRYSISRAADVDDGTTATYVQSLQAAGIIVKTRSERRTNVAATIWYRLEIDSGVEAPRVRRDGSAVTQGLAQEQMWRSLRMLKGDTNARELAAHAATVEVPVAFAAALDYLGHLHRASYLECTAEGRAGGGRGKAATLARYRLISNTGPRPPMVCRTDAIYDPNLAATVWVRPVTEEEAIYGR